MSDRFFCWVIYDHPRDHPDWYVARKFMLDRGTEPVPTQNTRVAKDLDSLREVFFLLGLARLARSTADDPTIIEVWM